MVRDVSDRLAIGRDSRRELITGSVGQCDRLAAGSSNAVEFTVTLAVDDDSGINGAGSIGQRGNGVKLRDVGEAVRGERKLHDDWLRRRGDGPYLGRAEPLRAILNGVESLSCVEDFVIAG